MWRIESVLRVIMREMGVMNDLKIALVLGSKIEYHGDGSDLILVLPDDAFFFFQTDIVAKKPREPVEAYATSNFPTVNVRVGYVKGTSPAVGFLFFSERVSEDVFEIAAKAKVVTSFFRIAWIYYVDNFFYTCGKIRAVVRDGRLLYYGKGLPPFDVSDLEKVKFDDKAKVVQCLKEILGKEGFSKLDLGIVDRDTLGGYLKKLSWWMAAAFLAVFFSVGGMFLRYKAYVRKAEAVERKLSSLYERALGRKDYRDPYGLLLYKASAASGKGEEVLRFLYALAKAHKKSLVVERILYIKGSGFKVSGVCKGYDDLTSFVDEASKKLDGLCSLRVKNTSKKSGELRFTLICS